MIRLVRLYKGINICGEVLLSIEENKNRLVESFFSKTGYKLKVFMSRK
jgi:hypothetical protein